MGTFKNRSDFFRSFAEVHFLVAHNVGDPARKSFFRINDEAELDAAVSNYSHWPCMTVLDFTPRYKRDKPSLPRRMTTNTILFLSRMDKGTNPFNADAQEAAYDEAFGVMEDFIAWMVHNIDTNPGKCGDLFLLLLDRSSVQRTGPWGGNAYGWELSFVDEAPAAKYWGYRFGEDGEIPDDGDGDSNLSQIIYFTSDETTKEITLSSTAFPEIQVWVSSDPPRLITVPVTTDYTPPDTKIITVHLPGDNGWIVLKF